jgi:streptomycin 6-kinase
MAVISNSFIERIIRLYGPSGAAWLKDLPRLIEYCARRWSLQVEPPINSLNYNYIAPAVRQDGTSLILKLGYPNPELATEIQALDAFAGRGAVRLIASDITNGAFLIERVSPGTALSDMTDDLKATQIACQVMTRLWRPWPQKFRFPSVFDWGRCFGRLREKFQGGTGPIPESLFDKAEMDYDLLLDSMDEVYLLHGDLHHWNILSSEGAGWLAIDPKGVIGERAFEIGAWMRNPFPRLLEWPNKELVLRRRLDILSVELGFDRDRLKHWAFAQAVLSACWSFEDGEKNWTQWIAVAELMGGIT